MSRRTPPPPLPTWVELLASIPAVLVGVLVTSTAGLVVDRFSSFVWWWLPLGHVLATPLMLWRPFEMLMIWCTPGVRPARGAQRKQLATLVAQVAERCAIRPKRWILVVEHSNGINASTSGRHVLAFTPSTLELPEGILAAVVAHELGHQAGMDTIAKAVRWWSLTPVRVAVTATRYLAMAALAMALVGWVVLAAGMVLTGVVYTLLLPLSVLFPLHAWLERRNELGADAFAAASGFGPALATLLATQTSVPRTRGIRRLLDTHPHPADRLDALVGTTT